MRSFNSSLYGAFSVPGGISWAAAQIQAEALGGHLAVITSAEENAFVRSLLDPAFLWSANGANGPWLGGLQTQGSPEPADGWRWVTGEAFAYSRWGPGAPDNATGSDDRLLFGPLAVGQPVWGDGPSGFVAVTPDSARGFVVEIDGRAVTYNGLPNLPAAGSFDFAGRTGAVLAVNQAEPGMVYVVTEDGKAFGKFTGLGNIPAMRGGAGNDRLGGVYSLLDGTYSIEGGSAGFDTAVIDVAAAGGSLAGGYINGVGFMLATELGLFNLPGIDALEYTGAPPPTRC